MRASFCPGRVAALALACATAAPVAAQDLGALLAAIPYGNGLSASTLCTRTQVSGLPLNQVRDDFVAPLVDPLSKVWGIVHWPGVVTQVSALVPFHSNARTAIYRRGMGCTIVPPGSPVSALQLINDVWPALSMPVASQEAWPRGEAGADDTHLSSSARSALRANAEALFREAEPLVSTQRQNTLAVLVAHRGQLVAERYAASTDAQQPQLGHSFTKTLSTLMVGRMLTLGRLDLDGRPPLPAFDAPEKQAIRWRHLLNLTSGLSWTEGYTRPTTFARMLYDEPDQAAFAASQPLLHTPGSTFTYGSGSHGMAMAGLRQLLGGDAKTLRQTLWTQLQAPLGMRNGLIEVDVAGTPIGGSRGVLRPRDWLRLAQLVMNDGRWQGQQLIAPDFIRFMKTPTSASLVDAAGNMAQHGAGLWRIDPAQASALGLPEDLVWMSGSFGQELMMVPSRQLAILRMGMSMPGADTRARMLDAVRQLSAALP